MEWQSLQPNPGAFPRNLNRAIISGTSYPRVPKSTTMLLRLSAEMEIFREVEQDENVIDRIVAVQREELELEIATLQAEAERVAEEARELVGEMPF